MSSSESKNPNLKAVYDRSCQRPVYKSSKKRDPSFKPSVLGSPCLRKIFYSYNKVEEDFAFPLSNSRIANLGTAIGEMLVEAFYREGIGIKYRKADGTFETDQDGNEDYEFRVNSPDLEIKLGKIDLVCVLDDGLWLSEFKSINTNGFKDLRGPKSDHLFQGVVYLILFNQFLREGKFAHIEELTGFTEAKGMRFLYYHKDRSEMKEFVVTVGDQIFKDLVTKIEQVRWYTRTEQLPPPTPDYCSSCAWRSKCEKNQIR